MDDLNRALGDISSIRQQMARSTEFRGYGPATLARPAFSRSALPQRRQGGCPIRQTTLLLFIHLDRDCPIVGRTDRCATVSAHPIHSGIANEMIYMAVEQFPPAAGAGALLTLVILQSLFGNVDASGLWQLIFSLGVFCPVFCQGHGRGRAVSDWDGVHRARR
jgi:hypothetical protein